MTSPPGPSRRTLLAGFTAFPVAAFATRPVAHRAPALPSHPFPHGADILVAGLAGGVLDRWSGRLTPALTHAMPPGTAIRRERLGAGDGVTAANRFAAALTPDGETALMIPGEAARAWAVGDPRVHYEVGHWAPVLAALAPAVLVGRESGVLRARRRLTLAADSPVGPALAGFLALHLLGVPTVPLLGLATPAARRAALLQHAADLVLVQGPGAMAELAEMRHLNMRAVLSFGSRTPEGGVARDPLVPNVPTLAELYRKRTAKLPTGPFADAFAATAAASRLVFGLVLPDLTPAALVGLWRLAGSAAVRTRPVTQAAHAQGIRLAAGPLAAAEMVPLAASTEALLALRHFLATSLGWRPR